MLAVRCEDCGRFVQEVDTLIIDGITLHILLCSECGSGAILVTNSLCENGNEVFGE